jgi:hypothetical protein
MVRYGRARRVTSEVNALVRGAYGKESDMQLKAGTKLYSGACDTEVMVIKGSGEVQLTCGGREMAIVRAASGEIDAALAEGTAMGKRYQNDDGSIELLCIKPGKGTLAIDGVPLTIKAAKALPSSD